MLSVPSRMEHKTLKHGMRYCLFWINDMNFYSYSKCHQVKTGKILSKNITALKVNNSYTLPTMCYLGMTNSIDLLIMLEAIQEANPIGLISIISPLSLPPSPAENLSIRLWALAALTRLKIESWDDNIYDKKKIN